ncbi:glyoxal oxidase-related protein [Tasmannia lanceolata]|uniref:glyoxal oxidase-related protein n=1 Tax=Tasmannia lanceolata TaxID=3420 RepID=UPI0040631A82
MTLLSIFLYFVIFLAGFRHRNLTHAATGGEWDLIQRSIGVSAMHMQLLNNDHAIIFDRTDFGPSNLSLPSGKCRNDPNELVLHHDCTAHSVLYDITSNTFKPLMLLTDTWCSSGTVFPDGHLVQTGGYNDGDRTVRTFYPCQNCNWVETPLALRERRWYATNQILPDGTSIIIGGRRQFNYEFYPKTSTTNGIFSLPFLQQTNDAAENNLYPFCHLNVDGNIFVFANNRAILLDYKKNVIVKTYPQIPGGDPRNYPSSGSSVLLPLKNLNEAEVLICGGAPTGSYQRATRRSFGGALNTCGRIKITDAEPVWEMETMPLARVMGDMVLLPNGDVLIINGASAGTAGWELGRNPVLTPVIYKGDNPIGKRFETQNPSKIPRMYHSTAILIRDGRVLVGGSNPHAYYNFTGVLYPTELSLEMYSPAYLGSEFANSKPTILLAPAKVKYGQKVGIKFRVGGGLSKNGVSVTIVAPAFATHSFSMNQRLVVLASGAPKAVSKFRYEIMVTMVDSGIHAPSGYYLMFVVNGGIPSEGIWVQIQ